MQLEKLKIAHLVPNFSITSLQPIYLGGIVNVTKSIILSALDMAYFRHQNYVLNQVTFSLVLFEYVMEGHCRNVAHIYSFYLTIII